MSAREAGELVRRYIESTGHTQTTVALELSKTLGRRINQGQVSAHVNGKSWGNDQAVLARAYCDVLGIPIEEMREAWGWESEKTGPRPTTLADVVKADKSLSAEAKRHLLRQYELLRMATRAERAEQPEEPRRRAR